MRVRIPGTSGGGEEGLVGGVCSGIMIGIGEGRGGEERR